MKLSFALTFLLLIVVSACSPAESTVPTVSSTPEPEIAPQQLTLSPAELALAAAVKAHGGELYEAANYQFVFRGKTYSFNNKQSDFRYSVTSTNDQGHEIIDHLEGSDFRRSVAGETVELSDKDIAKYTEALNSVIYFATLPHKLQDPAVQLTYQGQTTIKDKDYEIIEVRFQEEGGGTDFDDEFYYWINQDSKLIDYLAYNYRTNGGGVRFRSAYNTRNVEGIIFQDYVNYKAAIGTPLADLPGMYENDNLDELSRIETEDVVRINP